MANTPWKKANLVVLSLLIIICLMGNITFGHGLGDVFYHLILYFVTGIQLILTLVLQGRGKLRYALMTIGFAFFGIYMGLEATLYRGPEYPWNGSLFYQACPRDIPIDNSNTQKVVKKVERVTMCSMDYYTEFDGTWDGNYLKVNSDDLRIPGDLHEYVHTPINRIEIIPKPWTKTDSTGETTEILDFALDTLVKDQTYRFSGEIRAVHQGVPVFEVLSKEPTTP